MTIRPQDLDQFRRAGEFPHGYPENVRRFYAPNDDVHGVLLAVCQSAKVSLACAMYGWDDDELDQLFRDAWQQESLPVRLALDSSQAGGLHERAILAKWPTDVVGNEIVTGRSVKHAISHLKLFVVDGVISIGGSTNVSDSGESKQNNELTVIFDPVVAALDRAKIDLTFSEMLKQQAPGT